MGGVSDVTLRAADTGDLDDIADVFLSCWLSSYAAWLPARLTSLYGPTEARNLWRRTLARVPTEREIVVAEGRDGVILGVMAIGPESDRASLGHIYSLYVRPDSQGLGVGSGLLDHAIGRFVGQGFSEASLWVFEANTAGRAFYERSGWRADGTTRVEAQYGERELRFTRPLARTGDTLDLGKNGPD